MIKIDKKFLIFFVLFSIFFSIVSLYYYHKTIQDGKDISWVDFRVYYNAGVRMEAGENIYNNSDGYFSYKYSPIFAVLMTVIKFSTLTPAVALGAWYLILFISLWLSIYLTREIVFFPTGQKKTVFFDIVPLLFILRYLIVVNFVKLYIPVEWPLYLRICDKLLLYILAPLYLISLFFKDRKEAERKYMIALLLTFLFLLRFLLLNIDRAQVNIPVMMLLLFFIYYILKKNDVMAGTYLGIAMIFKLTPILFLWYLVIKKKFAAFFSSIAVFLIFLFIPSYKLGIDRNIELLKSWSTMLRSTFFTEYLDYRNQSIIAMISRFFSKYSDVSLLGFDQRHLMVLLTIISALFFIVLTYVIMKKSSIRSEKEQILYDFSLCLIAMTALSPVGTKATFIYMLLPIALLIKDAFESNLKNMFLNSGLAAFAAIVYLSSPDILGKASIILYKYSILTFSLMLLLILISYSKFKISQKDVFLPSTIDAA